ncbi:hypothetical protein SETIT_5G055600v2 [Setaria italica]|uniref:Uncharacterized protein n=2 Tax=Setaria TaxID=4554 RepID=A0A368R1N4_SETIT|nr:hypothetical protein SETIT_5G055600v2 [Setaria italica]TKW12738.1 hypothetical protein SEVIR_5G055000v2 [Setaria viridis]
MCTSGHGTSILSGHWMYMHNSARSRSSIFMVAAQGLIFLCFWQLCVRLVICTLAGASSIISDERRTAGRVIGSSCELRRALPPRPCTNATFLVPTCGSASWSTSRPQASGDHLSLSTYSIDLLGSIY